MYWADGTEQKIYRANLDGTGAFTEIFNSTDGVNFPEELKIDSANQKLLWVEGTKLLRGNLDGSGTVEEVISDHINIAGIVLTPDADGDEVPDEIDGCESDAEKTAPGDCGCGAPDTDSNSNDVADCLLNEDVKQSISDLIALVKSLKAKKKKQQKSKFTEIKTTADDIRSLVNTNIDSLNLKKPKKKVKKFAKVARKKALKSRKTTSPRFKRAKKAAIKALKKLNKAIE